MSKRYINVPKHPGIRKDTVTGKYQALKKIGGKQFAETFESIRQAQHWRNVFNGDRASLEQAKTTATLSHVWSRMKELHFPSLELSTRRIWERRWTVLSELGDHRMEDITSTVINRWIERNKKFFTSEEYKAKGRGCAGRCNLYNELNLFTTIFNWYKAEDEFEHESRELFTPIRPRHKKMAFIREPTVKPEQKKITVEAAFKFISALTEIYADLALVQFYCAGRIGETAGIQIPNIYLEEEYFMIKDSISWCNKSKMFEYLKPYPKNKEARRVHIHGPLREIIERRLKDKYPGCNYLFHIEGRPLNYCTIQANYRLAQQKTGIPYRGTHCLRHGMATLARRVGGMGLDSVVAMTGHKDLKLADHYSKIDGEVQKETSIKIVEHIRNLGLDKDSHLYTGNVVTLKRTK
ncbi:MAG: site-specific integrase [Bdellovibrionales bacterium]|nr:site-specific integrase [Bdellovibrionales bacterium]